jgi:hypothetical protein
MHMQDLEKTATKKMDTKRLRKWILKAEAEDIITKKKAQKKEEKQATKKTYKLETEAKNPNNW